MATLRPSAGRYGSAPIAGVKLSIDNPLEEALEPLDDWSENALEPLDDWSEKALEPLDDWPKNALRHRKWRGDRDDQGVARSGIAITTTTMMTTINRPVR
ncbi:hypothetical protein O0544_00145 [Edwardsiella anguillarum]|nr:hypothetical protein [Edwardsiella anguillarum]